MRNRRSVLGEEAGLKVEASDAVGRRMAAGAVMFERRLRERELAGGERAGSWSRRRARQLQYRYLRSNWPLLLGVFAFLLALSSSVMLLPGWARGVSFGAWAATSVAVVVHAVVIHSGSAQLLVGELGEQWTHQELAPLRRMGWRVVHRVLLRAHGDVDHVLLGPAGVVVIETKWSATDWTAPSQRRWIDQAARQVAKNARIVGPFLRPHTGRVPVWRVVVLWPAGNDVAVNEVGDVTVLPGHRLQGWIRSLPVAPEVVEGSTDRGWSALEKHLERRDAADLQRDGPAPRSVLEYLTSMFVIPTTVLGGLVAGANVAVRVPSVSLLAVGLGVAWLSWYIRRLTRHVGVMAFTIGFSVAITGMFVAVLIDTLST